MSQRRPDIGNITDQSSTFVTDTENSTLFGAPSDSSLSEDYESAGFKSHSSVSEDFFGDLGDDSSIDFGAGDIYLRSRLDDIRQTAAQPLGGAHLTTNQNQSSSPPQLESENEFRDFGDTRQSEQPAVLLQSTPAAGDWLNPASLVSSLPLAPSRSLSSSSSSLPNPSNQQHHLHSTTFHQLQPTNAATTISNNTISSPSPSLHSSSLPERRRELSNVSAASVQSSYWTTSGVSGGTNSDYTGGINSDTGVDRRRLSSSPPQSDQQNFVGPLLGGHDQMYNYPTTTTNTTQSSYFPSVDFLPSSQSFSPSGVTATRSGGVSESEAQNLRRSENSDDASSTLSETEQMIREMEHVVGNQSLSRRSDRSIGSGSGRSGDYPIGVSNSAGRGGVGVSNSAAGGGAESQSSGGMMDPREVQMIFERMLREQQEQRMRAGAQEPLYSPSHRNNQIPSSSSEFPITTTSTTTSPPHHSPGLPSSSAAEFIAEDSGGVYDSDDLRRSPIGVLNDPAANGSGSGVYQISEQQQTEESSQFENFENENRQNYYYQHNQQSSTSGEGEEYIVTPVLGEETLGAQPQVPGSNLGSGRYFFSNEGLVSTAQRRPTQKVEMAGSLGGSNSSRGDVQSLSLTSELRAREEGQGESEEDFPSVSQRNENYEQNRSPSISTTSFPLSQLQQENTYSHSHMQNGSERERMNPLLTSNSENFSKSKIFGAPTSPSPSQSFQTTSSSALLSRSESVENSVELPKNENENEKNDFSSSLLLNRLASRKIEDRYYNGDSVPTTTAASLARRGGSEKPEQQREEDTLQSLKSKFGDRGVLSPPLPPQSETMTKSGSFGSVEFQSQSEFSERLPLPQQREQIREDQKRREESVQSVGSLLDDRGDGESYSDSSFPSLPSPYHRPMASTVPQQQNQQNQNREKYQIPTTSQKFEISQKMENEFSVLDRQKAEEILSEILSQTSSEGSDRSGSGVGVGSAKKITPTTRRSEFTSGGDSSELISAKTPPPPTSDQSSTDFSPSPSSISQQRGKEKERGGGFLSQEFGREALSHHNFTTAYFPEIDAQKTEKSISPQRFEPSPTSSHSLPLPLDYSDQRFEISKERKPSGQTTISAQQKPQKAAFSLFGFSGTSESVSIVDISSPIWPSTPQSQSSTHRNQNIQRHQQQPQQQRMFEQEPSISPIPHVSETPSPVFPQYSSTASSHTLSPPLYHINEDRHNHNFEQSKQQKQQVASMAEINPDRDRSGGVYHNDLRSSTPLGAESEFAELTTPTTKTPTFRSLSDSRSSLPFPPSFTRENSKNGKSVENSPLISESESSLTFSGLVSPPTHAGPPSHRLSQPPPPPSLSAPVPIPVATPIITTTATTNAHPIRHQQSQKHQQQITSTFRETNATSAISPSALPLRIDSHSPAQNPAQPIFEPQKQNFSQKSQSSQNFEIVENKRAEERLKIIESLERQAVKEMREKCVSADQISGVNCLLRENGFFPLEFGKDGGPSQHLSSTLHTLSIVLQEFAHRGALIESLTERVRSTESECRDFEGKTRSANLKIAKLEKALESYESREEHRKESEAANTKRLESELARAEKRTEDLNRKVCVFENHLKAKEETIEKLRDKLASEITKQDKRAQKDASLFKQIIGRDAKLRSPIDTQTQHVISMYEAQRKRQKEEIEILRREVTALGGELKDFQNATMFQKEAHEIYKECKTLKMANENLREEMKRMERERAEMERAYEERLSKSFSENKLLSQKCSQLQIELKSALQTEIENFQKNSQNFQKSQNEREESVDFANFEKVEFEKLEIQCVEQHKKIKELMGQTQRLQQELLAAKQQSTSFPISLSTDGISSSSREEDHHPSSTITTSPPPQTLNPKYGQSNKPLVENTNPTLTSIASQQMRRDKDIKMLGLNETIGKMDARTCKQCLMEVCRILRVRDADVLVPNVKRLLKIAASMENMEKYLSELCRIVASTEFYTKSDSETISPQNVLETIGQWASKIKQTNALEEMKNVLIQELKKRPKFLSSGSKPEDSFFAPASIVSQVCELISTENEFLSGSQLFRETEMSVKMRPDVLVNKLVSHFQTLFDVKSIDGILPKMNEVYLYVHESRNAMRALRSIVGLDPNASIAECLANIRNVLGGGGGTQG